MVPLTCCITSKSQTCSNSIYSGTNLAVSNSEFIISAAFQESSFLLWDLKSGKIIKSIIVDDEFYWDTNVINVYGDFVITVGYATLKIWDIESGKKIKELKLKNW